MECTTRSTGYTIPTSGMQHLILKIVAFALIYTYIADESGVGDNPFLNTEPGKHVDTCMNWAKSLVNNSAEIKVIVII